MSKKRTYREIEERVRKAQRERREKRRRVVRYPTKLATIEHILQVVGDLDWYAVLVSPQKEFAFQEIMARTGIITYCPTDVRWRRVSRYVKEKERISFPLVPGYVFVGIAPSGGPWHQIFRTNLVRGVIGLDGEPFPIPRKAMERMVRRYRNGFVRPDEEKFMRTYKEFKVGDTVRVMDGPLRSFEVPVVEISGPNAKVMFELFGAKHVIEIHAEMLEPAA